MGRTPPTEGHSVAPLCHCANCRGHGVLSVGRFATACHAASPTSPTHGVVAAEHLLADRAQVDRCMFCSNFPVDKSSCSCAPPRPNHSPITLSPNNSTSVFDCCSLIVESVR